MAIGLKLPFQKACYDALTGDAELMGKITGVFDNVPEDQEFPYIQIGSITGLPWDAMELAGEDMTLTFHVWSRYRGKKEMKEIMDDMYRILHDNRFGVSGATVVVMKLDYSDDDIDPDGVTNHGVQRFRALIHGGG